VEERDEGRNSQKEYAEILFAAIFITENGISEEVEICV
jgi:hypothetical protein